MKFRTEIPLAQSASPIDYNSTVLLLGSCFAVNIGEKFEFHKFRNLVNPFGILFHPLAIEEVVHRAVNQRQYEVGDLFFSNERWHSFEVHSDLSHTNQEIMLQILNERLETLRQALIDATHIIITFGTAWVYRENESRNVVANCHKVPSSQFEKELLSIDTVEAAISNIINLIRSVNANVHINFTISPVRHIKDGIVENQRSKSNLISALHNVLDTDAGNLAYFPAYEILMDELRDYRYYADDLIHPSSMAIEYIWQQFTGSQIDASAYQTMEEVAKIQKSVSHRPFDDTSPAHQQFLTTVIGQISRLETDYPHIKF